MKIVLNNDQYKITIPKDLAEEKGWGPGTKIRFVEDLDGRVFLKVIEVKALEKKAPTHKIKKKKK